MEYSFSEISCEVLKLCDHLNICDPRIFRILGTFLMKANFSQSACFPEMIVFVFVFCRPFFQFLYAFFLSYFKNL